LPVSSEAPAVTICQLDGDCVLTSTGSGILARASTMYSPWFSVEIFMTREPVSASPAHAASGVRPDCALSAALPSQRAPRLPSVVLRSSSTALSSSERLCQ
jgi:hypothetical protein